MEKMMALALAQARLAAAEGEIPVGAVLVRGDQVLAQAHNRREATHDPTGHAEIQCLREGAQALGDWRLRECTLYVTLEPCPMCAGAMLMALLVRLVPQGRFSLMPALCTFMATVASGTLFVVLLYSFFFISGSAAAPLAVFGGIIFGTAAINSIIVQLLYLPAAAALRLSSVH